MRVHTMLTTIIAIFAFFSFQYIVFTTVMKLSLRTSLQPVETSIERLETSIERLEKSQKNLIARMDGFEKKIGWF